jgi:hypothetical protein
MSDRHSRNLERQAAAGDAEAERALALIRCREGQHSLEPSDEVSEDCAYPDDPDIHECRKLKCSVCGVLEETINPDYVEPECDLCGLCEEHGSDKMALWTGGGVYWPGERRPETRMVHAECEWNETERAHAELSPERRRAFLGR